MEPRWMFWSRARRAPLKTQELINRIVQFEVITGIKVTPERMVQFAKDNNFKISITEAKELLALRYRK